MVDWATVFLELRGGTRLERMLCWYAGIKNDDVRGRKEKKKKRLPNCINKL